MVNMGSKDKLELVRISLDPEDINRFPFLYGNVFGGDWETRVRNGKIA